MFSFEHVEEVQKLHPFFWSPNVMARNGTGNRPAGLMTQAWAEHVHRGMFWTLNLAVASESFFAMDHVDF